MDLSERDLQQIAEADRREVDPPIQVETATWSKSWPARLVGEENGRSGSVGYAVQTAVNGGSELLIFVLQGASDRGLSTRGDRPSIGQRKNEVASASVDSDVD